MPVHKDRFRRSLRPEAAAGFRPVFDDCHLLRMEGDYEYPRHQHANYEAILVERGPYRCELNRGEITLVAGQVLIVKPGDWHSDHLRDGQRHYVLHFRLAQAPGEPAPPPVFREDTAPTEQICRGDYLRETWFLQELRAEAEHDHAYAAAVQDGLLSALFWRLVRGLEPTSLSPRFRRIPAKEARREKIAQVFSRFLTQNPNLPDLAGALGISTRHLTNECERFFGLSPARMLLRMKMERAEELLRYRGLRVNEVSDQLGFSNPYHFSTAFRRLRGCSPSKLSG